MVSSVPDPARYALANAASTARYSSRVGSYDTFSSDCASCACAGRPSTKVAATAARAVQNVFCRSEEHTSELQSLMRISYAVFCLQKKTPQQEKILSYITRSENIEP